MAAATANYFEKVLFLPLPKRLTKFITIPHSTVKSPFAQSKDQRRRWDDNNYQDNNDNNCHKNNFIINNTKSKNISFEEIASKSATTINSDIIFSSQTIANIRNSSSSSSSSDNSKLNNSITNFSKKNPIIPTNTETITNDSCCHSDSSNRIFVSNPKTATTTANQIGNNKSDDNYSDCRRGGGSTNSNGGSNSSNSTSYSSNIATATATSPITIVGKTLLNTNPNLLPITTATDTFNNLKNLVKIDNSSGLVSSNNYNSNTNYRNKSNNNSSSNSNHSGLQHHQHQQQNHQHHQQSSLLTVGSTTSSVGVLPSNKVAAGSGGLHFSTGYNKNFAKIRQYDSDVSPRPRRPYQSDSSSSRYYNKNSDVLGQGGRSIIAEVNNRGGGGSGGGSSGGVGGGSGVTSNFDGGIGRRPYNNNSNNNGNSNNSNSSYQQQNQQHSDGGYNRNLNNSGGSSGIYRQSSSSQSQSRYENSGQSQRNYGSGAGYYNNNSSNSNNQSQQQNQANGSSTSGSADYRDLPTYSSGGGDRNVTQTSSSSSGGGSSRQYQQQQQQQHNNYRDRDYDEPPRSRYNNNYNNNSNSLERSSGGGSTGSNRYKNEIIGSGGGSHKSSSSGPQDSSSSSYERSDRSYNHRNSPNTQISGGGGNNTNATLSSIAASSSSSSASSSSAAGAAVGSSSSFNNSAASSSGSRAISPNSAAAQHQQQQQHHQSSPINSGPIAPLTGRWVPPSLRPQHLLTQKEKNDVVFRKVRGILNKLTPEKFQELSDDLLKLDLNSKDILNGVILLIFDKALDEPKYSSMYAQLCKRLAKEAPSFEEDHTSHLCTFLRLLIAVCREKFNYRLRNNNTLLIDSTTITTTDNQQQQQQLKNQKTNLNNDENKNGKIATEEEEKRHLAKQRMLGNVKFIGELNKLQMLSATVLHQCIQQLLDKKKKRSSIQEMCEDMECVSQLLKTCGKNLDSEQCKELMKQYFERLERRSKSTEYPPRIRFMLKDVIELRENNWIPRKVGTTEGPVPIKQIRTDDDNLIRTPYVNRNRDVRNNDRDGDNWMNRFPLNLQPGFNDMFGSLSVGGSSPIMSPGYNNNGNNNNNNNNNRQYTNQRNNQNSHHNNYNNRYTKHNMNQNSGPGGGGGGSGGSGNNSGGGGGGGGMNRDNRDGGGGGGGGGSGGNNGHNQHNHNSNNMMMMHNNRGGEQSGSGSQYNQMLNNKELAPRFKRNLISTNQDPVENLQMRPAANSLLFKAASQNQKTPAMLPISTPPGGGGGGGSGSGNSGGIFGNGFGSAFNTHSGGNNQQHKDQQLTSNQQYPLLATPSSHLSNPIRPSSTPSAEHQYDSNLGANQHKSLLSNSSGSAEKGLKSISSSPDFSTTTTSSLATSSGTKVSTNDIEMANNKQQLDGGATSVNGKEHSIMKHGANEKVSGLTTNNTTSALSGSGGKQQKKDKNFNKDEVLKKTSAYIKERFFYSDDESDVEIDSGMASDGTNGEENIATVKDNIELTDSDMITAKTITTPGTTINTTTITTLADKKMIAFVEGFTQLKVPEKCMKDVCINMVMDVLDKSEDKYLDRVVIFLHTLRKQSNIKPNIVLEVFKQIINKMNEREALNPRIATHVAYLLSKAVGTSAALLKLNDIAAYTDNGQHYPLFLLVLQQMHKSIGKDALEEKFRESKIDLMNSLPEVDRNKARLAEILDDRALAFLYPLLKVQAEMFKQLTSDPTPAAFYKWIKTNVDSKYYKDPGFVTALMTVILKFVTQETTMADSSDIKKHPEKAVAEKEEAMLHKYCQILETFLSESSELQLIALYALQVFSFNENFPKGMLCRWFKYLYETNVIEEDTFFSWKEEISDKYPGKGSALFQVNNWLTWLEEAESEDEED